MGPGRLWLGSCSIPATFNIMCSCAKVWLDIGIYIGTMLWSLYQSPYMSYGLCLGLVSAVMSSRDMIWVYVCGCQKYTPWLIWDACPFGLQEILTVAHTVDDINPA